MNCQPLDLSSQPSPPNSHRTDHSNAQTHTRPHRREKNNCAEKRTQGQTQHSDPDLASVTSSFGRMALSPGILCEVPAHRRRSTQSGSPASKEEDSGNVPRWLLQRNRFNFCVLQNTATPTPQFSQRGINRGGGTPPKQGCPIFGPVQCTGFKIFAPSPAEMAKMLFWHIWLLFSGCFISSENAYSFWRKVLEGNLPWGDSGQQHPDLNHISALAAQGSHQGNCALAGHPALWILTTSCGGP